MFSKLSKKYGLSIESSEGSISYYNEYGERFFIEKANQYISKIENVYIKGTPNYNEKDFYNLFIYKNESLKDFHFFILRASKHQELKEFISGLIYEAKIIEYEDYLIVIYKEKTGIELKTLSENLKEDFYINIESFEEFKVDTVENFLKLFVYYRYYLHGKIHSNIKDLIIKVVSKNNKDLIELKRIVLKNIYNDSQMEKLIDGMFENNLNVSKTANSVYMHRNTINNKLEIIKDETGLDIQNFKDAMAMYFIMNAK